MDRNDMPATDAHLLARLRFRHLQLIAEIERTGSLSASAAALNLTQPALSKALKEVEAMLGFRLFNRGARGLQKTAQGEIVMHGAILMLREVEHLHAEARSAGPDGSGGTLDPVGHFLREKAHAVEAPTPSFWC